MGDEVVVALEPFCALFTIKLAQGRQIFLRLCFLVELEVAFGAQVRVNLVEVARVAARLLLRLRAPDGGHGGKAWERAAAASTWVGVGFGCETCGAAATAAAAVSVAVGERVLCVAMLALLQGGQAPRTPDKQGGHKIWAAGRCSGGAGAPTAFPGQLLLLHVLCCACVHVQTPSIVAERQRRAHRTNIHAIVAVAFSTCGDVLATPGLRCESRLHSSAQRGRGPVDLPHTERVVFEKDLQT